MHRGSLLNPEFNKWGWGLRLKSKYIKIRKSSFMDNKSDDPSKKGGRLFSTSEYETGKFKSFILKSLK